MKNTKKGKKSKKRKKTNTWRRTRIRTFVRACNHQLSLVELGVVYIMGMKLSYVKGHFSIVTLHQTPSWSEF